MIRFIVNLIDKYFGASKKSINPDSVWDAKDYKPFFDQILTPVPLVQKEQVWNHFLENCESQELFYHSLHEGCMLLDREHWIFMQVDWKAVDEIEWQANAIAGTHGLTDTFSLPDGFVSTGTVDEGIKLYDVWLQDRGYKYVSYDPGNDAYYGFICKREDVDILLGFATSHELNLAA